MSRDAYKVLYGLQADDLEQELNMLHKQGYRLKLYGDSKFVMELQESEVDGKTNEFDQGSKKAGFSGDSNSGVGSGYNSMKDLYRKFFQLDNDGLANSDSNTRRNSAEFEKQANETLTVLLHRIQKNFDNIVADNGRSFSVAYIESIWGMVEEMRYNELLYLVEIAKQEVAYVKKNHTTVDPMVCHLNVLEGAIHAADLNDMSKDAAIELVRSLVILMILNRRKSK